jgi:hypothetical protein
MKWKSPDGVISQTIKLRNIRSDLQEIELQLTLDPETIGSVYVLRNGKYLIPLKLACFRPLAISRQAENMTADKGHLSIERKYID